MSTFFIALIGTVGLVAIVGVGIWFGWRVARGYATLQAARTVKPHEHVWSPWDAHEAALYEGSTLVRYAPGQLRTCLDPSCNAEDIRLIGGQTTSGEKDL